MKINSSAIAGKESNIYFNIILELFSSSDPYTYKHSYRVANLSRCLGEYMNLPGEYVNELEIAGYLHDIGKIRIPENILNSDISLSDGEREVIRLHPQLGYEIIEPLSAFEGLLPALLFHHERHDGTGYPIGLKGEEIPDIARILSVTDSFDAMASDRPYRKRMSFEDIVAEIQENKGKQFDPLVVDYFCDMLIDKSFSAINNYQLF